MNKRSSLSFGMFGDRPIFMDPVDDSYFLLEGEAEADFLRSFNGNGDRPVRAPRGDTDEVLEEAKPPAIARSFLDEGPANFDWRVRDIWAIARLLRRTRSAIAQQPLSTTLAALSQRADPAGETPLSNRLGRFTAARRFVPLAPHCLTDSLALIHWLPPSSKLLLVFGVKLDPFGAHCWVQHEDVLLNDREDLIAPFRPVRVVRCASASQ